MNYALATHQNTDISWLFSIYELLIDEKYEFKFTKRSTKSLLKTFCLSQHTITPPLSRNQKKLCTLEKLKATGAQLHEHKLH